MTNAIWIGVDVGTTGVRAVAYQVDGTSLESASALYPLNTPYPEWAEQDPFEVIAATEQVIQKVGALLTAQGKKANGLSFSTVFHSFLAYDENFKPITTLMTWGDNRSSSIVNEMKKTQDCLAIYQRTGCPLHPMYPMTKVAWLREKAPDIYQKIHYIGSIKDFVFKTLTGEWVLDRSVASGSGLYNLETLSWDKELLEYLNISEKNMPPVVSTTYSQKISKEAAKRLGLAEETKIVIGAGDGVLVNVGLGAVNPGQVSCTIGTSGAIRMLSKKPKLDPKGRTWCYNLTDDVWVSGGAINNGGLCLRWVREKFCEAEEQQAKENHLDVYDLMTKKAEKVAAGSEGLLLLPFFTGERAPNWNADIRAMFFGLTLSHKKEHFIRATMEGVCYRMHSILKVLEEVMGDVNDIRVSGSFTHSKLWLQILADILNKPIGLSNIDEGAAFGAALLGFVSEGVLKDISDTSHFIKINQLYYPNAANRDVYDALYDIYDRIYWNLQKEFSDIAAFQKNTMK